MANPISAQTIHSSSNSTKEFEKFVLDIGKTMVYNVSDTLKYKIQKTWASKIIAGAGPSSCSINKVFLLRRKV